MTGINIFGSFERQQHSVFVGNIPYETTEEDLREIFGQAGPVLNIRLVYDRESGKPKGYGFIEFMDVETAQSALRNLNGYEFRGRQLRVDSATGEKSREELALLQSQMGPIPEESPFGKPCDPREAPEAISRAVASLPPEQMFELMRQMKQCIQNNPNEARNMLLQNPQLAYALLQAQVVMRIVDPQVAMAMLHRDTGPMQPPLGIPPTSGPPPMMGQITGGPPPFAPPGSMMGGPPPSMNMGMGMVPPPNVGGPPPISGDMDYRMMGGPPGPGMMMGRPSPPLVGGPGSSSMGMMPPQTVSGPQQQMDASEDEKTKLIMQVLSLTDDQIASLPADQRQSILMLREQLMSQGGAG